MTVSEEITCASYERVSTRKQGQFGFSLGVQSGSIDEFVARQPTWVLPPRLRFRDGEDENASGADWDLPGLTAMLDAARRREFTVLIVPHVDRFARTMEKGLALKRLLKGYGVQVVFISLPVADGPVGNLMTNQMLTYGEFERENFAWRSKTGRARKAELNQVVGTGEPPYGYAFDETELADGRKRVVGLRFDPKEKTVVERMLRGLLVASSQAVSEALWRDGERPRHAGRLHVRKRGARVGTVVTVGERWAPNTIRAIARNPVYKGVWCYRGHEVDVPPLVDAATWDAIQAAVRERRQRPAGRLADDPYCLRGCLRCAACGGGLQTGGSNGVRYYDCAVAMPSWAEHRGCARCALPSVNAGAVEAEVWRLVGATVFDPVVVRRACAETRERAATGNRVLADRLAAVAVEANQAERRLSALVEDRLEAGPETRAIIQAKIEETERSLARLRAEQRELSARRPDGIPPGEEAALVEALAEASVGWAMATAADRQAWYRRTGLTVAVEPSAAGARGAVKLGRKHWYVLSGRLARLGDLELLRGGKSQHYGLLRFSSSGDLALLPAAAD